jgi:hypothetical protein
MTDRILSKYSKGTGGAGPNGPRGGSPAGDDGDGTEDGGESFGWLRGIRDRAVMLELRKKTGAILAVGYGWIEKVEFDPTEGITFQHCGVKIRIKGRNLNGEVRQSVRLFEGIVRHRVSWIQEADHAAAIKAAKSQVVVQEISW